MNGGASNALLSIGPAGSVSIGGGDCRAGGSERGSARASRDASSWTQDTQGVHLQGETEIQGREAGSTTAAEAGSLWFARRNAFDLVYLTTFDSQAVLIDVLQYYGFAMTGLAGLGEQIYEKALPRDQTGVLGPTTICSTWRV